MQLKQKMKLNFLNDSENAFYYTRDGFEILIRAEEKLANFFQDVNSGKLENVLKNVRELDTLGRVGWFREIPDVVKLLREDIKVLYKECRIKNIQNQI